VLAARVAQEYGAEIGFEAAPFATARWIRAADEAALKRFIETNAGSIADDRDGRPVFLARNAWELGYVRERSPGIDFAETRELVG
jgi:peptide chain release factor 3